MGGYSQKFIPLAEAVERVAERLEAEGWPSAVLRSIFARRLKGATDLYWDAFDLRGRLEGIEAADRHLAFAKRRLTEAEAASECERIPAEDRRGSQEEAVSRLREALHEGTLTAVADIIWPDDGGDPRALTLSPAVFGSMAVIDWRHSVARFPGLTGTTYSEIRVKAEDVDRLSPVSTSGDGLPPADNDESGSNRAPHDIGDEQLAAPPGMTGTRSNRAERAEAACQEWITGLTERPANLSKAYEAAQKAVSGVGPLSRKAFDRAWHDYALPAWKEPGRRKKSLPP